MKGTMFDMATTGDNIDKKKPGEKLLDWESFAESLKIESKETKEKLEEKIVDLNASIDDSLSQN